MNLFDQLVAEALNNQPNLRQLKAVVEKELLHHDILRILSEHHFLTDLTFIGGTCLRSCYGGVRLSEDLDFTGGRDFDRESLTSMSTVLIKTLQEKYGLSVVIKEPVKDINNVDTWKIKIETRPQQKHMPAQRINIDICRVHSYEPQPMLLINPYGVDMGTGGLIVAAQGREEIFTDKILAFALRPNRLKHRDLWDMIWLHQAGIKPRFELIPKKLDDRKLVKKYFIDLFSERHALLINNKKLEAEFYNEMQRFLPADQVDKIIKQQKLWSFIVYLIGDIKKQISMPLA